MDISRVVEVKNVSSAYCSWGDKLQLDVDGGVLNIALDKASLRRIAKCLNDKIEQQDEAEAEAVAEAAAELAEKELEHDES